MISAYFDPTSSLPFVHRYLPLVLAADGSDFLHWSFARVLSRLAECTLPCEAALAQAYPPAEAAILWDALRELHQRLRLDDPFPGAGAAADWGCAQAHLRRVMPLVEQQLALATVR
jgi:hypothetical protein